MDRFVDIIIACTDFTLAALLFVIFVPIVGILVLFKGLIHHEWEWWALKDYIRGMLDALSMGFDRIGNV